MTVGEMIAFIRGGSCNRCKGVNVMRRADVATFTLAGTKNPAGYDPSTWEGWKCKACQNAVAIGLHLEPSN